MSTAGRIFVVLNLVFAAGFVFFAGTHLQGAADYKQQLASYKQEKEEEVSRLTAQLTAVTQDREDANRELSAAQTARDNFQRLFWQSWSETARITIGHTMPEAVVISLIG